MRWDPVKPGDVIVYSRSRRKPTDNPETYNFVGVILEIVVDTIDNELDAKIFWSDLLIIDLVPVSMINQFYEVIHETW